MVAPYWRRDEADGSLPGLELQVRGRIRHKSQALNDFSVQDGGVWLFDNLFIPFLTTFV